MVEHDIGFAPNPFWGICSLANCKPVIRRVAEIGDTIIGTGSATSNLQGKLIYWMKVDKIIDFNEYWTRQEYEIKKPFLAGSKAQQFGDNIYYKSEDGKFMQSDSFHSEKDGSLSESNCQRDTANTERILLGKDFAYFGSQAIAIPSKFGVFIKKGPGHKNKFSELQVASMDKWLTGMQQRGCCGVPVRW